MFNNNLMNYSSGASGIYRAKLIIDDSDIRVYVPALHTVNPFDENDVLLENYNKDMFPLAIWCAYNLESIDPANQIGPAWVMFENGNMNRPVILSYTVIGGGNGSSGDSSSDESNTTTDGITTFVVSPEISTTEYIYPLSSKHTLDPFSGGRAFGASRNNGARAHAGIDLIVPPGTKVIAMTPGKVNYISYNFYGGTDAIITQNSDGSWFTYGELKPSVSVGQTVNRGDVIGTIKANNVGGSSMLHFEAYKGDYISNVLTNNGSYKYVPQKNYKRRADLIDPSFVVSLPMYNNQ